MIGNHRYPIKPYIQTRVAFRAFFLFKVHVYIEILLHMFLQRGTEDKRSVCGCGNDVVSTIVAKGTLIAKSKGRE